METMLERLSATGREKGIHMSTLMIIFLFIAMGSASILFLVNSAA